MSVIVNNGNPVYIGNQGKVLDLEYSIGAGVTFDKVNDYITIPNTLFNFEKTDSWSIATWFRTGNTLSGTFGFNNICGKVFITDVSFNSGWLFGYDPSGVIQIGITQQTPQIQQYQLSTTALQINTLYFLTATFDGASTFKIYINAVENPSNYFSEGFITSIQSLAPPVSIGGIRYYSDLTMYDLKIFNKVINQVEIDYLFSTKSSRIPSTALVNVLGNWTFNQKQGTTLIDTTGSSNGTLINFANTTPSVGNAWVDTIGNSILV